MDTTGRRGYKLSSITFWIRDSLYIVELRTDQLKDCVGIVCVQFHAGLPHSSLCRLVEWVEAARAWGVDNISLYLASTHPNVTRVLHHYQREGYVSVVPWNSPDSLPTLPHLYRALFDTQR